MKQTETVRLINIADSTHTNMVHKLQELYQQNNKPTLMYVGEDTLTEYQEGLSSLSFEQQGTMLATIIAGTECILKLNTTLYNTGKAISVQ